MNFDYDILFGFLSDENKKYFQVWGNVFLSGTLSTKLVIKASYRAMLEETISIPFEDYQMILKQKERDKKLNDIL